MISSFIAWAAAAQSVANPVLVLSTSALELDSVLTTYSSTKTVTITNAGTANLAISDLSISGVNSSDFSVSGCTGEIAPNGACTLTVTFAPTSGTGIRNASLSITHNGINSPSTVSLSSSVIVPDNDFYNVVLLTHFDGSLADSSNSNISGISIASGGTLSYDSSMRKYGSQAIKLGTTNNSYISVPANANLNFGTGPFTIEFWVAERDSDPTQYTSYSSGIFLQSNATTSGNPRYSLSLSPRNNAYSSNAQIYVRAGDGYPIALSDAGGTITSPPSFSTTFKHVALIGSGSNYTIYVDGTVLASGSYIGASFDLSQGFTLGYSRLSNTVYTPSYLYIDEMRITKGIARYTSSFTPPVAPFASQQASVPLISTSTESLTIASANVGQTSNSTITVTNTGSATLTIANLALSGTNASEFSVSGCTGTLAANSTCTITTTFAPTSFGSKSATLTINSDAYNGTKTVALSSTGLASVIGLSTSTLTIDATNTGSTKTGTITVTNTGNSPLTISNLAISGTNASEFSVSGCATPIAANSTCVLTVTFAPSTTGSKSATLSITHDASGSPSTVALSSTATSAAVEPSDPYFTNVSLLLHMDGANNSTTFTDSTGLNTLTAVNGTKISTTQSKFGGASGYFDGTNDYLSIPYNSGFAFGTGDFTIEAWVYKTSSAGWSIIFDGWSSTSGNQYQFGFVNGTYRPMFYYNNTYLAHESAITANQWTHVAVTRQSGTLRIFLNGQVGSSTVTLNNSLGSTATYYVGSQGGSSNYFTGYMDDLRVTKGIARYTANFTPPTAAFPNFGTDSYFNNVSLLMHMDGANNSDIFTDSTGKNIVSRSDDAKISTAQSKFGGASAYFDGAGDYLTIPASTDFNFGTGDFTVECWIKVPTKANNSNQFIVGAQTDYITGVGWSLQIWNPNSQGYLAFMVGSSSLVGNVRVNNDAWNHVTASRSGTTLKLFVNGVQTATGTFTNSCALDGDIRVGATLNSNTNRWLSGYVDDLRITKGVARYTANFTPSLTAFPDQAPAAEPTTPSTDSYFNNVSLLLHMDGANNSTTFTDNSPNALTVTRTGNAIISTTQNKFGGASAYFDGSGDYLSVPYNSGFAFGTSDFTIEAWVYRGDTSNYPMVFDGWTTRTTGCYQFGFQSGGYPAFWYYPTAAYTSLIGDTAITVNQWNHIAVSRESGTLRLFLNGSLIGSKTATESLGNNVTYYVGAQEGQYNYLNGYIDDLRVTKGVARYTSAFTPPTAAFPNSGS